MGDVGETFNAMREDSKHRRSDNRKNAVMLLNQNKTKFVIKNGGAHIVINDPYRGFVDFWPGTGKYIFRTHQECNKRANVTGRGIFNLMKKLKEPL